MISGKPHYENVPFEIPDSWEWVKLGDVYKHNTGKALNAKDKAGKLHDYITTSNLYWDKFDLTVVKRMLFTDNEVDRCSTTKGDLLVCEGGDIGRAAIWCYDYNICLQNHIHRLRGILPLCNKFYYYIFYYYKFSNRIGGKGMAIQGLSADEIDKLLIPLPSVTEQERIVKDIEKWFALISNIEDNKLDLQEAIKQTKSKILSLAISGKIVQQYHDEEPAIELLKRIDPKFQPCDTSHYENIPQNWCVCKFKDIFEITMGSSPTGDSLNRLKEGVEFHQGKICFTDKYLSKSDIYTNSLTKLGKKYSILLCVRAPVGLVNITERDICIGRGLCALHPKQGIDLMFAFYALQTYQYYFDEKAIGSTFKAIGGDTIREADFLLPPYDEQIRIRIALENMLHNIEDIYEKL